MCFSSCYDLNLSPQENQFASAHFDGSIRLWAVRTGELVSEIKQAHDDQVSCVKFTPDEKYLVSTGKDNSIRVFDLRMNKEVQKFYHDFYKCSTNSNRLCLSANGRFVVVGSSNGAVVIYDTQTQDIEEIYSE